MARNIRRDRAIDCARNMPPLLHSIPEEKEFDVMRSEVAEWLCGQPSVREYIFTAAKESKLIVYDKETGTWRGVDRK